MQHLSTAWALERLDLQRRALWRSLLISIPAVPPAVALVFAIPFLRRTEVPTLDVLGPFAMWCAITYAILGIAGSLLGRRRLKLARRIRPVLETGQRMGARIHSATTTSSQRGGVQFFKLTIGVVTDTGGHFEAYAEEPVGTELPHVAAGLPAAVWFNQNAAVVGAGDGLFEAAR